MEKYRPSNGSEGCSFESVFCDRCKKENPAPDVYCDIHTNALVCGIDEPDYPQEWQYKDGRPVCTAFEPQEGGA